MKLLVLGGSGLVGSLIVPTLSQAHHVRVLDLKRPSYTASAAHGFEYVTGSVDDYDAVHEAAAGMEILVYLAMSPVRGPHSPPEHVRAGLAFDVNVKGPYIAYWAAADAGIHHAVHASSLSVYPERDFYPSEADPPDSNSLYGLTKRLGEEVCRHAIQARKITVNALRLCHPIPDDEWPRPGSDHTSVIATRASDVAAAFEAALHYRDGFQAFFISGDSHERYTPLGKARQLLGWAPTPRPMVP
ncbi:NAD-dependent epimerase/dehydratase family protein [Phytoactinopolyspora limicola]|uniref:NAD-dependent epimerase/dehydratase family protein n=1 Tax=Phytoactinopolyspora limicola TaxID=2715536 RepID=UPI00140B4418|nr:NAD(P)-dependent oxidoreductase [Phytoactinopolyspora limicola]